MPQVAEDAGGEGTIRGSFGPENQRRIICQGLGNYYTMVALSYSLSALSLVPLFLLLAWCCDALSHYLNSPGKLFDQVA